MNLQVIAEHTVDLDLLPAKASILDAGCLGFIFYDEMKRLGHKVVAIDIQELDRPKDYVRIALADKNGTVGIKRTSDKQASSIIEGDEIPCATLETLSEITDTPFWDLIKLDIEAAEYEVIMSLSKPPATQISWEAHLHTGAYGMNELILMEAKLRALGYKKVYGTIERRHGLSENAWDNLWILE